MRHGRADRHLAFFPGSSRLVPTILSRRVNDPICLEHKIAFASGRTLNPELGARSHSRFCPIERFIRPDGEVAI
jgi:hypothetical protein